MSVYEERFGRRTDCCGKVERRILSVSQKRNWLSSESDRDDIPLLVPLRRSLCAAHVNKRIETILATTRSTPGAVILTVRGLNASFRFGCPRFSRLALEFRMSINNELLTNWSLLTSFLLHVSISINKSITFIQFKAFRKFNTSSANKLSLFR